IRHTLSVPESGRTRVVGRETRMTVRPPVASAKGAPRPACRRTPGTWSAATATCGGRRWGRWGRWPCWPPSPWPAARRPPSSAVLARLGRRPACRSLATYFQYHRRRHLLPRDQFLDLACHRAPVPRPDVDQHAEDRRTVDVINLPQPHRAAHADHVP